MEGLEKGSVFWDPLCQHRNRMPRGSIEQEEVRAELWEDPEWEPAVGMLSPSCRQGSAGAGRLCGLSHASQAVGMLASALQQVIIRTLQNCFC